MNQRFVLPAGHIFIQWEYILLLAVILSFLFFYYKRKSLINRLGNEQIINLQITGNSRLLPAFCFLLSALYLIVVSIKELSSVKNEDINPDHTDVIFAIDVSRSMRTEDIMPSRLLKAVDLSCQIVSASDRVRFGVVTFNNNTYLHTPLTADTSDVIALLRDITKLEYPDYGTDILSALRRCAAMFNNYEYTSRNIILISDGEDRPLKKGRVSDSEILAKGINLYTIGVGTLKGSRIPAAESDRYLVNDQGEDVISKLNDVFLKEIAESAAGRYFQVANGKPGETAVQLLTSLNSEHSAKGLKPGGNERKPAVLLVLVLLLLLTEMLLLK